MSRAPFLDQAFGMDRLAWAHKWLGFATVWLIAGHVALTVAGFALGDRAGFPRRGGHARHHVPVHPPRSWRRSCCSWWSRSARSGASRRRMAYETWFTHAPVRLPRRRARVRAPGRRRLGLRERHRRARVLDRALRRRARTPRRIPRRRTHRHLRPPPACRLANVVPEAPGVVSIYLTGRDLDRLPVRAGQYFLFRFLTVLRAGIARTPSRSAPAPNGRYLRITVKDLGDWTAQAADRVGRHAGLHRGPVWGPHRRPADPAEGPPRGRWRGDRPAPLDARGLPGRSGRHGRRLPRPARRRDRLPPPSSITSPARAGRPSTTSSAGVVSPGAPRPSLSARRRSRRSSPTPPIWMPTSAAPPPSWRRHAPASGRSGCPHDRIHLENFAY